MRVMMSNRPRLDWTTRGAVVLAVLAALAPAGRGQYYISQDGRLLDANNRVGSFGLNTEARLDPLVNRAQSIVTGNVTGGLSFQGVVPYGAVGEFQGTLGSGLLSSFRRDTTGVGQLSTGLALPQLYIDPSRQVSGTFGGQVAPSGVMAQSPVRVNSDPYQQSNTMLGRDLTVRPLARQSGPMRLTNDMFQPQAATAPLPPWLRSRDGLSPANRGLTGLPLDSSEQTWQGQTDRLGRRQDEAGNEPSGWNSRRSMLERPEGPRSNDATLPDDESSEENGGLTGFEQHLQATTPRPLPGETTAETGPDGQPRAEVAPAQPGTETGAAVQAETNVDAGVGRVTAEQAEQYQRVMNERARTRYEELNRRGFEKLRAGKFYQAANAFDNAALFADDKVLCRYHKAHALLAAGEFMSAAYYLVQALDERPALAAEPLDLADLYGSKKVAEDRLVELERWYERTEQPMLLLLTGYLQYRSGQTAPAKETLEKVRDAAPELGTVNVLLDAVGHAAG